MSVSFHGPDLVPARSRWMQFDSLTESNFMRWLGATDPDADAIADVVAGPRPREEREDARAAGDPPLDRAPRRQRDGAVAGVQPQLDLARPESEAERDDLPAPQAEERQVVAVPERDGVRAHRGAVARPAVRPA